MLWSRGWQVRQQETLRAAGTAQAEQAEEQVPTGATSNMLEEQVSVGVMSSVLEAGRVDTAYREAQYRKRALALRRASGTAARVLVAPEDVSAKDILPEGHNGFTSMVAISCVLVFATFVAF
ncbi:hypothetical protein DL89DRAFT_100669 [Linderina pennispora]|uniref:Uncharacterized protein n=1 Tax=Linderina pennispora TaxID=61395 RepID=A0A1Y1VW08_9FUNG|nr:uncharacterized protein DL89DRAFT_100669 [Linderina pennispora]ORX65488.1 hypothetical protein DL89DRAFT_100669 [Linderina pennispora]